MTASDPLPLDPIAEARRQWTERGWGEVADGMAAVTSLMRAQQIVLARVEAVLRPRRLTFARYELLMLLTFSRHGAMSMKRASSRLQVHPTSVTNAVDRLEAAGLVVRRAHPRDGRATLVELTPAGRTAAEDATTELNATVFAAPGLDPGRLGQLVEVLTELRRDAGDFEG
ncbi:MarR family transcriptional regulator [Rhodococcus antarcticus]|uniref:MarR family transcriptional regulator n=1 Tax=Rhodococcus antarcticus TaxID=2987751 RepID=A0ABY6P1J9_9NOCA|nr:MarR family transcriptional regulator [Rhodococcus antarcticus]UZJ25530.1 MarR family transcriptional regulator [Rhodococcus antarcticus]